KNIKKNLMKTIIVGDIHGRDFWKNIANKEEYFDRFIFIGDYFDSFNIGSEDQIKNFLDICEFKEKTDREIIMLIGNHDLHYYPEIGYNGTSGYQEKSHFMLEHVIQTHRDNLQMAYEFDNILCTHAGVGETWLRKWFPEPTKKWE